MPWLQSIDVAVFRFLNLKLRSPVLDAIMPQFSSNGWFIPLALFVAATVWWRGDTRARLFVLMLGVLIVLGDSFVINTLKHAIGRPRPAYAMSDTILLVGK